jgi:hypothetical protein
MEYFREQKNYSTYLFSVNLAVITKQNSATILAKSSELFT